MTCELEKEETREKSSSEACSPPNIELEQYETVKMIIEEEEVEGEEEDETSCDVASFAQVTYANYDYARPEDSHPELQIKEVKEGKENYCHLCQHTFNNK